MKMQTTLTYFFALILSLSLVGCGLVGTLRTNKAEVSINLGKEMPEWLTVAHRVQTAERPQTDTEKDESRENDTEPLLNQPASPQPGSDQPEQQTAASGTPKWQQPGTMEYIAKQQLDQLIFGYKRLLSNIADLENEKNKNEDMLNNLKGKKKDRDERYKTISEVAVGIGLSLEKEYGIKPPPVEATEKPADSTWFHNWEQSPSGFGD